MENRKSSDFHSSLAASRSKTTGQRPASRLTCRATDAVEDAEAYLNVPRFKRSEVLR